MDPFSEHIDRRSFVRRAAAGLGALAAGPASLFGQPPDSSPADLLSARPAHFKTSARACIYIYPYGGPSQMDLFDYKPYLQRMDGKTVEMEIRRRSVRPSRFLASRRKFYRRGESGLWCSDALPHLARHMDKLAVIKSLYMDSFAHGSANLQMNTGQILQGFPSLGSWLLYALGTRNRKLPGYVVMTDPRGGPIPGAANWSSGFMPAAFQGTVLRSSGSPILDLASREPISPEQERARLELLDVFNREHLRSRLGDTELEARMASYELAHELQSSAPEALDVMSEDEETLEMYGFFEPRPDHRLAIAPAHFGRQCLIARRLVERGVRFVQLYTGGGHQQQNWDAHQGVEENLAIHCPEVDRPMAGLLEDLERRGLLEETLVIFGGEFGRQPVAQDGLGRDHNPKGFSYWMAGGGVKPGTSYGETDETGHEAAVNRHHIRDLHATILHLMGLDHERLTYHYGGLDRKLTGVVPAEVIRGLLA